MIQRGKIISFPEKTDRNLIPPLVTLLYSRGEVGRIMPHVFQLFCPVFEKLVGVFEIECHARTEGIDERKPLVLNAVFDEIDEMFYLPGISPSYISRSCSNGERNGKDRILHAACRRTLRFHPFSTGRRNLTRRKTINLIVHHNV